MPRLFRQTDPVSGRAQDLNREIAALEKEINELNAQLEQTANGPRFHSTAQPDSSTVVHRPAAEPVFEDVDLDRLKAKTETVTPVEQYNELGVRKYDLAGLLARAKKQVVGPTAGNPRLVTYLLAGGVQGLRPLRYEKRVARNRLLLFVVFLLAILVWVLSMFIRTR